MIIQNIDIPEKIEINSKDYKYEINILINYRDTVVEGASK